MNQPLLLGLGILYLLSCVSAKITYDGYKVYRMWPNTEDQRMYLKNLEDDEVHDFWAGVTKPDRPVEVMVKPEDQVNFVLSMLEIGLEPEIFVENVNKLVDPSQVGNYNRVGMTWTEYFRINDIYSWFDDLTTANPTKVSIVDGGSTFEGRQIKGVKISNGPGKKAVFFEGGIHAREWIGPATVTYIINELLASKDPEFKQIAESFDWYLFPVTNPDGYEYSHTDARHWRKTRTIYPGTCRGADPNRNWNIHWMEQGASTNCSSDTYAGPKAFSELETASLSEFIKTIGNDLVGYISFHAYGQMLMVPYGHTEEHLDNYNDTVAIGQKGIEALAVRYGTNYTLGNIAETIYKASGSSLDWVKNEFGTPLVYVYELRDRGHFGAFLPPDQIIPNSLEIVDSLVAMFQEADKRGIVDLIQKGN